MQFVEYGLNLEGNKRRTFMYEIINMFNLNI